MIEEIGLLWDEDAPLIRLNLAPPTRGEKEGVMEPSKEAMEAAAALYTACWNTPGPYPAIEQTINKMAQALDDHTAALRAEVEALRARVAELEAKEGDAFSKEIEAVEARMEAQRNRLMRYRE